MNNVLIYGKHPIFLSLKQSKRKFFNIFVSNENNYNELIDYLDKNKINLNKKIISIKNNLNKQYKDINHQGFIAVTSKKETITLDYFCDKIDKNNLPKLLILDQLTDPHNIGAIIRTAIAFNINYIIITKHNSLNDSSIIVKSSAGMSEMINIIEVVNVNNTIDILKNLGYFILGLAGEAKFDIKNIKDNKNLCLIIGSEGNGIRQLIKKNCDMLYKITTNDNVESLNASVAAAIAIYKIWG